MRDRLAFPLFVVLALMLSACEIASPDSSAELDAELEDMLVAKGGPASFRFPEAGDLTSIPQDPANPITEAKVALGQLLFHETALATAPAHFGAEGQFSCASCHHAAAGFQAGVPQGIGEGGIGFGVRGEGRTVDPAYDIRDLDVQPIRSPSAMNTAYQEVMLWNGQFGAMGPNEGTDARWTDAMLVNYLGYQGLESQAIAGLLVHRMASPRFASLETSLVASDPTYQALWQDAFGSAPVSRELAGLAIAAYERTLLANEAPFQRWLGGQRSAMNDLEKEGAILFFGRAECVSCHAGPALSSMTFFGIGMADLSGPDVHIQPDHPVVPKGRGAFTAQAKDDYAFKTPQLYNLADSPFLGHGASFRGVREVIQYKNLAVPQAAVPESALSPLFRPLGLSESEVDALTAFVESALRDPNLQRYVPESLPSGNCFPFNDPQSRLDLGCN